MHKLERLLRNATAGPSLHLRAGPYGAADEREFLIDVIGLANAEADGLRLAAIGVDAEARGSQRFAGAACAGEDAVDFAALVAEYVEPELRLDVRTITVENAPVTVIRIADSHDRPYMMRIDHCASLRRGDAYQRVGTRAVKMGRRQLEKIFARKFRDNAATRRVDVGFAGDFVAKDWHVPTVDVRRMPSEIARAKLRELIDAQDNASGTGSTTVVARLTHARLFGSDQPYRHRSRTELLRELAAVGDKMWNDDQKFLYARHGQDLDVVMQNHGDDAVEDVEVALTLPLVDGLHVANPVVTSLVAKAGYPRVDSDSKTIRISGGPATVEPGSPQSLFARAARVCVSRNLAGRRIPVAYTVTARNLPAPLHGRLQITCEAAEQASFIT